MVPFASRRITLLAMSSLAFGFFLIDHNTIFFQSTRAYLGSVLMPLLELSHVPIVVSQQGTALLKTKQELVQDIAHLKASALAREFQLQRYAQLEAENQRLRSVLALQTEAEVPLLVAQVLLLRMTTVSHKLVIDKGSAEGVSPHAIVFDAYGIVGQVHSVRKHHSWVTLMSDPEHSIPVELTRTGVRGVLQGVGDMERLDLSFIPETADVQVGDRIVTSGLGGRFPAGYPLAVVNSIQKEEYKSFASISAQPQADLSRLRFVLVRPPLDLGYYNLGYDESARNGSE